MLSSVCYILVIFRSVVIPGYLFRNGKNPEILLTFSSKNLSTEKVNISEDKQVYVLSSAKEMLGSLSMLMSTFMTVRYVYNFTSKQTCTKIIKLLKIFDVDHSNSSKSSSFYDQFSLLLLGSYYYPLITYSKSYSSPQFYYSLIWSS